MTASYDWKIPYSCVTDSYLALQIPYFNAMPIMAQYLQNITASENYEILENFLKASGAFPDSSGNIVRGYLSQYPHVVQYAENFFRRFDSNEDSIVDTAEAMVAFPVYKEIMKVASNGQLSTDKQLKALFAWILVYGTTPKPNEFARFSLAWLPKGEKGWNIKADRKKIAAILGYLASSLPPKVMN